MLEAGQAMAVTPETVDGVAPGADETAQASQGQNSPRERRSRDRYGRDRRERGERNGGQGRGGESQGDLETADADGRAQAVAPATEAVTPVVNSEAKVPTTTSTSANRGGHRLPRVQSYKLPLGSLNEVASAVGLQWVNSDADKVAAVQAAIAAEPKPVHVPRERPAPVVHDEGPLILVETRKDLSALKLPFEQS
jgi:ribonuclease E